MKIKHQFFILISGTLLRLVGNILKIFSYPFHWLFPQKRFTIPVYSPPLRKSPKDIQIPRIIWQTNYSNKVTLPIYCNYLVNRLLALSFEYRYVSTEEREEYIKANAEEYVYQAYCKLNDGAAQADFWRIFTLYHEGGTYMDIDGHLVWCLDKIIEGQDNEVLIVRRQLYTNFFMASKKANSFLKETLDIIIDNIENQRIDGGVFSMTGPTTLNSALQGKKVNTRSDKLTCIQGTFSNEYFQYMDKKRGKWNHTKKEDLLKKE
ncbi:glycosyltransferase family 32 protein [Rodentibacter caecimuris]|uniref:Glycosyl transferase n=1 Tax=Rodentibacter caecimuris TaxID=1796644 RepID=A0ABX3KWF7_9PAST|nr:glycosyl transferase [Rodentibacter heylii]